MTEYTPPLEDYRFILNHLIGALSISALPGLEHYSADLAEDVLTAAAQMAAEVFAPLNQIGDTQGAKLQNGKVLMPKGFTEAYHMHVEGGWNALPVEEEFGGQNLPWCLAMPVQEMWQSANLSLALCTLLNQGAIELLSVHGSAELKSKFLPKLVQGEWTGTMNLTEPNAGSDVGAVQCRAIKEGDKYKIYGQKIFISYGDHDMAGNILHFVLARLPAAPQGTRGISLFLVPKFCENADGNFTKANDVKVVSIEHKLGQHASPTCVMAFGDTGGAEAYLVGKENGGMPAMFTMMNNARIGVGIQGLGLMERSLQHARTYAKTRIQGRALNTQSETAVSIIHHPDVKRMLLKHKAATEAARALAFSTAFATDKAKRLDGEAQIESAARVELLTPIVKSWLTDLANEFTSEAIQVFGGMGYVEETGIAQHMRDARVLAIYEGTNGIQANDLVFRKILKDKDKGNAYKSFTAEIENFLSMSTGSKTSTPVPICLIVSKLKNALADLNNSTQWVLEFAGNNPAKVAASAVSYLRLFAVVCGGYYLAQSAFIAAKLLDEGKNSLAQHEENFLRTKILTAEFYAHQFLAQSVALHNIVTNGADITLNYPVENI